MCVSETRISGDPIFFSSRGILAEQLVTFESGQILGHANLLAKPRYFGFLFVSQPMQVQPARLWGSLQQVNYKPEGRHPLCLVPCWCRSGA